MSTPPTPRRNSRAARSVGGAVVLAVSCVCAVMWALLIRAHLPGPASLQPRIDYADLLPPGEQERSAQWGIYLGPQRIGGSTMHVKREEDGTIAIASTFRADLGQAARYVAGFVGALEVDFRAAVSPLRGLLSWQLKSEALDTGVLGLVRGDRMLVKGRLRGRPVDTEMAYEPEALISEAFSPLLAVPSLGEQQVGQSWATSVLNPVTGEFQDVTVRVARSQEVRIGEESVLAFKLDFRAPGAEWTCWATEDGKVLVQGTPFGLTLRREDLPPEALRALSDVPATPADGGG